MNPGGAAPALLDDGQLTRTVTVTPGMSGSGALIFGQMGDWTWDAVRSACGTNVYVAHNAEGDPTYLSFYYFHVLGSPGLHPYGLAFGDELEVTSRVFDFGRSSVLTLHRIARAGTELPPGPLEPDEFYQGRHADCIYVENFNRWITRGRKDSNQGLVESTPVGFRHSHLPRLPNAYSPRVACTTARRHGTFHPDGPPGHIAVGPPFVTEYTLDPVRDVNAVGLAYFAAYFSIVDGALLRLWRTLGRSAAQFLRRRVLEHQLGYFGNADLDATLEITVALWRDPATPDVEVADVAVREQHTDRLLAVAEVRVDWSSS
ncbi:MAG TPA: LnmK family bifunctional acyltransferase/decarboxylase [Pseudonocardiaceae bacterium]|jgi:probable biosynthetic protein (TIGR04098 family)